MKPFNFPILNTNVPAENGRRRQAGKPTIHETNNNGVRLVNLAGRTDIVISSTMYTHSAGHKVTWMTPDQKTYTDRPRPNIKKGNQYKGYQNIQRSLR
ncbi:hypothetical protein Trydic_g11756 [Trypoxylus dichotomus]